MAVTVATLTANLSTVSQSSYTSASISPAAGKAWIASIKSRRAAGSPTTPTIIPGTGSGITWTQIATVAFGTIATPTRRITVFRGVGASPGAGTWTADFGGVNQDACAWSYSEITGGDPDIPMRIDNVNTNSQDTGVTISVPLGALGNAANAGFASWMQVDSTTFTANSGWTVISSGGGLNNLATAAAYSTASVSSADMTWSTTTQPSAGVTVELVAAGTLRTYDPYGLMGFFGQ